MVIEAHCHVFPAQFLEALASVRPSVELEALKSRTHLFDWNARLAVMDRHGIDMQALVLARPPVWLGLERGQAHALARVANDAIAEIVSLYPDRFVGIGVLPVMDDVMLAELERLRTQLHLAGVCIFSNVEGQPLDAPEMWPLYEAADALSLPIWIHPQHGPAHQWTERQMLNRLFVWPLETTLAMARIVYGGVFDRFPNLKFVTHHLGGMVPFYGGRIETFTAMLGDFERVGLATGKTNTDLTRVTDHFRRFYGDTAVGGSDAAIRCGLDYFGARHLVFGTDFPFGAGNGEDEIAAVLGSIQRAPVSDEDRERILSGNARAILGLN